MLAIRTCRHFVLTLLISGCAISAATAAPLRGSIVGWDSTFQNQLSGLPAGDDFVSVSAGSDFGLALRADGSIVAWPMGPDFQDVGQLNVPAGNDYVAITAGMSNGVALRADGSLVSWGRDDPPLYTLNPDPAGNDFTDISAGFYLATARRSDGTATVWLAGGQVELPGSDFVSVSSRGVVPVALREDGSIFAFPVTSDDTGLADVPAGNDFVMIDVNTGYGLAIREDGSLVAWGDLTQDMADVPTGNDFVAISAGTSRHMALREDGSLVVWGSDPLLSPFGPLEIPGLYSSISTNGPLSDDTWGYALAIQPIPEPSSLVLAGVAAVCGLAVIRRRGG